MENDELRQQVLDKMTKTCPCRVVTRARVKEAIRNGAPFWYVGRGSFNYNRNCHILLFFFLCVQDVL